ncbi:MAG: hypothetical protein A3D46_03150 [Candidatus Nealsonbacteria bacterium RIFCSPHIGHO2_02_FULL_43_13]|uniref:Uncharacterized protein n=1 Tax=Candidatus Nealsonbacteria bacterium RIFCSPHIGHO2_02_FULL_43_13 TaxID=1801668 RepID=A0A1G2E7P6_9BACT|nr:MAG: hypothetical protein A3D46_03150 [Candidatus Nealsonbacteria bacterium RIFCSPHIGHO2_02_FULL_43_13]
MENDLISNTLGNLYQASQFKLGDLTLAQFAQVFNYWPVFETTGAFAAIKLIFSIAALVFGAIFLVVVIRLAGLNRPSLPSVQNILPPQAAEGGAPNTRWNEIIKHINSYREAEWKFAVIEADKLIDETLKNAGFPGDTLGERLMGMERGQLATLDGLWEAHKIRNKIAHDSNYFMRYAEAKKAVELYEKTLNELGAI